MKTKLILATLLTVMSVAVFAKGNTEVVYDSTSVFKVFYTGKAPANVKISIFNAKGKKIFSETIKSKEGFVRPYNMNDMAEGTYKFEINDGNGVEVYEFDYSLPKVANNVNMKVQKMNENKFFLMLSTTEKTTVEIKIVNDEGTEVYKTTEELTSQFSQIFNLNAVDSKEYTFSIYADNKLIKSTSL